MQHQLASAGIEWFYKFLSPLPKLLSHAAPINKIRTKSENNNNNIYYYYYYYINRNNSNNNNNNNNNNSNK